MDKYIGEENIDTFFVDIKRVRPSGRVAPTDIDVAKQAPATVNNQDWKKFI